jgi:hypothetical protein
LFSFSFFSLCSFFFSSFAACSSSVRGGASLRALRERPILFSFGSKLIIFASISSPTLT